MTTLTVSTTDDYSADDLSGTDVITFTNAPFTAVSATFVNTQFGSQIAGALHLNSSDGANIVLVNGGSVSALNWTFSNWTFADTISLTGSAAGDNIFGSSQGDVIRGGAGLDVLFGAQGNDTIVLEAGDFVLGEMIDGSVGDFDILLLDNGAATANLTANNAVSNIERLVFAAGGGSAKFAASSFGTAADKVNAVTGNTGIDTINVIGSVIDLSPISFLAWSANDTIVLEGTTGNDSIRGSDFADTIQFSTGEETIKGGGGNDTVNGGLSAGDRLDGGAGNGDTLLADPTSIDLRNLALLTGFEVLAFAVNPMDGQVTASGTQIRDGAIETIDGNNQSGWSLIIIGDDIDLSGVTFTDWSDGSVIQLISDGTASTSVGSSKADMMSGNKLNNSFKGGAGRDTIDGSGGTDRADYSDKTKKVVVTLNDSSFASVFVDGTKHDTIRNIEDIIGGSAGDKLTGDSNSNTFRGRGGVDTLNGGNGSDTADYSDKTKKVQVTLASSSFATVKVNGTNEDKIKNIENVTGGSAGDKLTGDGKNNTFTGKGGADTLDGAAGSDTADYSDKSKKVDVTLNGASAVTVKVNGSNEDSIKNIENVTGGSAGDKLTGDGAKNTFRGGDGKDTLNGAGGSDTADYSDKTKSVVATLNGSTAVSVKVNGTNEDSIKNIENIASGSGNDRLTGDSLANRLSGNSENDTIKGMGGKDTLVGGTGSDSLTGGSGEDAFLFDVAFHGFDFDRITDFKHADDTIQLDDSFFKAIGTGTLAANQFLATASGDHATSATQRIIYDKSTGAISYDADGDDIFALPILVAILTNKPTNIDHTDFKIV